MSDDYGDYGESLVEERNRLRGEVKALSSKLAALSIDHPTDICECRFDFSGGEMKVKHQCAYHKGIADRLDRCLAWCDREIEWLSRGPTAYGEGRLKSVQEIKAILVEIPAPIEPKVDHVHDFREELFGLCSICRKHWRSA